VPKVPVHIIPGDGPRPSVGVQVQAPDGIVPGTGVNIFQSIGKPEALAHDLSKFSLKEETAD